jgi:hypothetical protein
MLTCYDVRAQVTAGKMLWFPIPNDTFYDREDGGTENLLILLQMNDGLEMTPMSWIKLNETSKTLYGLPMEEDVGPHQYILAAVDSEGRIVKLAFEVVVERGPSTARISHEFSVILDLDFEEFRYKVSDPNVWAVTYRISLSELTNKPHNIRIVHMILTIDQ